MEPKINPEVNTAVWIHAMGSYYAGRIVKVTPTRLQVEYTSGAGKTRQKWVTLSQNGDYINSKYETLFPLVPMSVAAKPLGARARVARG